MHADANALTRCVNLCLRCGLQHFNRPGVPFLNLCRRRALHGVCVPARVLHIATRNDIGLRHDQIASLWKGFHACQHYDGDGWNGATLQGALERATRFKGKAVFQTDNPPEKFQPLMDVMQTHVTWAKSGLGAHSTAMFLDDRQSTQQLRAWFWRLVGTTANKG